MSQVELTSNKYIAGIAEIGPANGPYRETSLLLSVKSSFLCVVAHGGHGGSRILPAFIIHLAVSDTDLAVSDTDSEFRRVCALVTSALFLELQGSTGDLYRDSERAKTRPGDRAPPSVAEHLS